MSTQSAKARAQQKVRRQKLFIAVGSIVLLAVLGFEMTKVLSHGDGQKAAPPVSPATTSSSGAAPAASSSGWNLPDTDPVVVQRNTDQLISFGLFGSKDPFVQQLAVAATPAAAGPTAPATVAPAATATGTAVKPSKPLDVGLTPATSVTPAPSTPANPSTSVPATPTAPAPPTTTTSPTTPTAPEVAPTTALISTNGACEKVAVNGTFPSGADIFRLVSIARNGKSVEIGVAGGSYDSGQATVTLKLDQKLTLVNTADGTRYVIQFKSKCDVVRPASAPAGSAAPPPPPVPPAPTTTTTPTTTTPIVPDPLDTTTTPTG